MDRMFVFPCNAPSSSSSYDVMSGQPSDRTPGSVNKHPLSSMLAPLASTNSALTVS